jgi:hypothetical protein
MLRTLGSNKLFCDGLSRRDLLHVGPLGLTLANDSRAAEQSPKTGTSGFGYAKRCVLLSPQGSPSQIDSSTRSRTRRPKFVASSSRSTTAGSGIRTSEHFPKFAELMKHAVLRGMRASSRTTTSSPTTCTPVTRTGSGPCRSPAWGHRRQRVGEAGRAPAQLHELRLRPAGRAECGLPGSELPAAGRHRPGARTRLHRAAGYLRSSPGRRAS